MRFFWYDHVRYFQERFPEAGLWNDLHVVGASWVAAAAGVFWVLQSAWWIWCPLIAASLVYSVIITWYRIRGKKRAVSDPYYPGLDRAAFVVSLAFAPAILTSIASAGLISVGLALGCLLGLLFTASMSEMSTLPSCQKCGCPD